MDEWHFIAERKIREAFEEGAFEHLDGEGQPLNLEENPYEDPSLRMAHRILRNNGFAPAWIEEGRDIDAEIARVATVSGPERSAAIARLNQRIAAYNLKAPVASAQRLLLKP